MLAAGNEDSPSLEQAVARLEQRGPWRRKMPAATIRKSSDADLSDVLQWAKEDEENGHVRFYCNRRIIQECHVEGELHVLADPMTDLPIAYLADSRYEPYLMAVKADRQGRLWHRVGAVHDRPLARKRGRQRHRPVL